MSRSTKVLRSWGIDVFARTQELATSRFKPLSKAYSITVPAKLPSDRCKVAFFFPGQGAQYVGMAKSAVNYAPALKLFEEASEIVGFDLLKKCNEGPQSDLDKTDLTQLAVFVSSMATVEKMKIEAPETIDACTVALGLSLGEFSALCFAGSMTFQDGVRLIQARGNAMQLASSESPSGMVAILGLSMEECQEICNDVSLAYFDDIVIGNYLCPGNYVLSGSLAACKAAIDIAGQYKAKAVPLAVAGAFHSMFMLSAVPVLEAALREVEFRQPRIPVLSNVTGHPHSKYADDIRSKLLQQLTMPVQWESSITDIVKSPSFEIGYEIGPGNVCKGTVKKVSRRANIVNFSL